MKTSRDIESKYIVDLPIEKRFFKLPVENFLNVINITPTEPQIAIINAINDPRYTRVVACLSRRNGKSFVCYNVLAMLKLLEPNSSVLIMSPNYSIGNIGWSIIHRLIKEFDLDVDKDNSKDKEIEFSNGSFLKIGSVNQADSVVGRSYDLIIYEESAISSKGGDSFNIQTSPMLDKPNSKAIFISTPRGDNWFRTFYELGFNPDADLQNWISIHATWRDNPRVPESVIDQARKVNSDAYFRQEYEADFSTFEGRIFTSFSAEDYIIEDNPNILDSRRFEVISGIDMGFKDLTVMIVLAYDLQEDIFYVIDEYADNKQTTEIYAENFQRLISAYDITINFIDSAAAQTKHDLAMQYDITAVNAKKSVLDGIEYVHSLINQGKLRVNYRCTETLFGLQNYSWDDREGLTKSKPAHDRASHSMDALRYALYTYTR